ncbi:MAG: VOC family protein [Rhizobiales bacterium]|nr:VOC family protein [Hyphomicrobiales bacterium]
MSPPRLGALIPMLSVVDLQATRAFYCDRLGFRTLSAFGEPDPRWCMLERDAVRLMFNQPPPPTADEPPRTGDFQIFYFYPDDVGALHAAWRSAGLNVGALRVTRYGMKEFELRDPDGYWLWFGQNTDEPPTVTE